MCKTFNVIVVSLISLSIMSSAIAQEKISDFPVLKGPYLGQKPPGMIPEIFAPGIVSTGFNEHIAFFTPDGKEFYFRMLGVPHTVALCMKQENGQWSKPQVMSFTSRYGAKFTLSPDGNKIIFCSNRPLDGRRKPLDSDNIWITERTGTGWGEPKILLKIDGAYPTISTKGNLYFYSDVLDGMGKGDIWMSKLVYGEYTKPENLGDVINTEYYENDPFISHDESYLIFAANRPGGDGLYISFKKKDGSWTKSKFMGEDYYGVCPSVSPDGKYFFFSSDKIINKNYWETPITYEEKIILLNGPGNGSEDIYWVDAKIIDKFRPDELK